MKHHDVSRPIGKCKGCCLNQRTSCAAGLEPKAVWDRRKCRHYNDRELLVQLAAAAAAPSGAKLARQRRKVKADLMATEPHYNGVLDPGKMAGRAIRRRA